MLPLNAPGGSATKRELRVRAKARRARLHARDVATASNALVRWCDQLPAASVIGAYVPIRGEIDPRPLAHALARRDAAAVALPVTVGKGMVFRRWQLGEPLREARFGLWEPEGGEEVVPDLLLVPLLGFTRAGDRLGWGGGYYDRWIAGHTNACAVGVALAVQEIVGVVPREPHDRLLHMVLTEDEAIVCPAVKQARGDAARTVGEGAGRGGRRCA